MLDGSLCQIFIELNTGARDAGKGGAGRASLPLPFSKGGRGGESALIDKNSNPKNMRYND
jgi:hypothetical protein